MVFYFGSGIIFCFSFYQPLIVCALLKLYTNVRIAAEIIFILFYRGLIYCCAIADLKNITSIKKSFFSFANLLTILIWSAVSENGFKQSGPHHHKNIF
jgi:hypothetical protein